MPGITPNVALLELLDYLRAQYFDAADIRLFSNDITPDEDTELGDLTEVDMANYTRVTLSSWDSAAIDGSNPFAFIAHDTVTIPLTHTGTDFYVYGFYIYKEISLVGKLVYAQRFDSPLYVNGSDYEIVIDPLYKMADFFYVPS